MKKLLAQITRKGSELKLSRGERIVKGLEGSQEQIIRRLENDIWQAEDKLEAKLDLGFTHTTQLKFEEVADYDKFMQDINDARLSIVLLKEKLKVAEELKDLLFSEEKESKKSDVKEPVKRIRKAKTVIVEEKGEQ